MNDAMKPHGRNDRRVATEAMSEELSVPEDEQLHAMLTRLKLTANQERLDTLLDEAARKVTSAMARAGAERGGNTSTGSA